MQTKKTDYELFRKYCKGYIEKLHLDDWEIAFFWQDAEDAGDSLANLVWDLGQRACTFNFTKDFGDEEITKTRIQEIARHEVIHLLLARMMSLAKHRETTLDEILEENHSLTAKLGRII